MAKFKSPQDLMAARNPLARKPVAPVDIYTQPAQVEAEKPETITEPISSPQNEQGAPQELVSQTVTTKRGDMLKPYSTYLYSSQVKGIKLRAIEQDVNDFAIVQEAIDEYFKKHPL